MNQIYMGLIYLEINFTLLTHVTKIQVKEQDLQAFLHYCVTRELSHSIQSPIKNRENVLKMRNILKIEKMSFASKSTCLLLCQPFSTLKLYQQALIRYVIDNNPHSQEIMPGNDMT